MSSDAPPDGRVSKTWSSGTLAAGLSAVRVQAMKVEPEDDDVEKMEAELKDHKVSMLEPGCPSLLGFHFLNRLQYISVIYIYKNMCIYIYIRLKYIPISLLTYVYII